MFKALFISATPLSFLIEEGPERKFACHLISGEISEPVRKFSEEEIKQIKISALSTIQSVLLEVQTMAK